ncbi:TMEM165/GDT1 family protein [Deferrisoma sp.]
MQESAFLSTFGLVFLAELGDKTQLATLALAARYRWRPVVAGVFAAFALLSAAAVAAGELASSALPRAWVQAAAGVLFLAFGVHALVRREAPEAENGPRERSLGPFASAFLLIFLAELGDKTQLATAGLAAQWRAPWAVFAGSCLALWAASGLGLTAGVRLARRVSPRWLATAAGVLFLAFGLAALVPLLFGGG